MSSRSAAPRRGCVVVTVRFVFGLTGTSKLATPSRVEPVPKTTEEHDKTDKRIDAPQTACKPWRSVIYKHAGRANQVDAKTTLDEPWERT